VPLAGTGEFSPLAAKRRVKPPPKSRNLRISPPLISPTEPSETAEAEPTVGDADQNTAVDLGRLAWLGTVLACLIAVLILVLQGYYGYAGVTFAVAVAAAINLL
jgi:hypothetical protein